MLGMEKEWKKKLRQEMKARRDLLTKQEKEAAARACLSRLCQIGEFLDARWIYTYISCRNELETSGIIQWCFRHGKRVAAPKVEGKDMDFYEIRSLEDCVTGAYGIREPEGGNPEKRIEEKGFMLVPGLAFDKKGNRLGYGGGFYDRYLAKHSGLQTAALGYHFQVIPEIPAETHDIKMDYIITDSTVSLSAGTDPNPACKF